MQIFDIGRGTAHIYVKTFLYLGSCSTDLNHFWQVALFRPFYVTALSEIGLQPRLLLI